MATKSVRDIINNSIARLLPVVKKKVREEATKKLMELQNEIMTPEYIAKQLQPEINAETCSDIGKEKFREKIDRMEQKYSENHSGNCSTLGRDNGMVSTLQDRL